jgi:hypothetical protein
MFVLPRKVLFVPTSDLSGRSNGRTWGSISGRRSLRRRADEQAGEATPAAEGYDKRRAA